MECIKEQAGTDEILKKIFDKRGFDVRSYRMSDLQGRISRRMDVLNISNLAEYSAYLEANPDEYRTLFNTILVNVSQFFRDPKAWNFVRERVLPEILKRSKEVRLWSAGCSNGGEPYSLAIMLSEMLGTDISNITISIYATDIDEASLKFARGGTYSLEQLAGMPEDMKEKYFTRHGDAYAIAGDIRRLLVFSRHNLLSDPPIPHIDLLLCRNVLIYFDQPLQLRIMPKLYYALNDMGYLWLGKAESLLADPRGLKPINTKWRIFKNQSSIPVFAGACPREGWDWFEQIIQNIRFGFIMLDENFYVVKCSKTIEEIWSFSPDQILGKPFFELEISYSPVYLRDRIEQAIATNKPLILNKIEHWIARDRKIYLNLEIIPVSPPSRRPSVVVLLEDVTEQYEQAEELKLVNRALEAINEKLLSENEELENKNRQLQYINEALQSTNAELESINEERKATNEELNAQIKKGD